MGNSSSSRRQRSTSDFNYRPELDGRHTPSQLDISDKKDGRSLFRTRATPREDPPPSYQDVAKRSTTPEIDLSEDALMTLGRYDTVVVVDDSGSMRRNWDQARIALAALAGIASRYDADGIDIHFLNDERCGLDMRSSKDVIALFDRVTPRGGTPLGYKLDELLTNYIEVQLVATQKNKVKPVNFLVITDGAPTDDPQEVIIRAAKLLDAKVRPLSQVGIQFVQIGENSDAQQYLNGLDNDLVKLHGIRDMVDTTPYTKYKKFDADMLAKALLGGINRRVDKQNNNVNV